MGSRRGPRGGLTLGGNSKTGGGAVWTFIYPMWGAGCPGAKGRVEIRPEHQAGPRAGAETTGVFLPLPPCPTSTPRELDGWVFVELDVGSEGNADGAQIQEVLHGVISSGSIASYVTSPQGFQFRRLGTGEPILEPGATPPVSQTHVRPLPPFSVPTMGPPSLAFHAGSDGELTTS